MTQRKDDAAKVPGILHASPVAQAGFTLIPNAVMLRRDLTPEAKLIYGYLKHLAWRSRAAEAESPRDTISTDLGISLKLVTKSMQLLAQARTVPDDPDAPPLVISIRRGLGLPNVYRINEPGYVPEPTVAAPSAAQRKAWQAVHRALRVGDLVQGGCAVADCFETETEAHHEDYAKPLEVVWLCSRHHRAFHASGKPLSGFLDGPVGPVPARARSSSEPSKTTTEEEPPLPPADQPPPVALSDGRNVPLDTLLEVCLVTNVPENQRAVAAAVVLNGRLHRTTGALLEPGIRHLFWGECRRQAEADSAVGVERLRALQADPARFADLLADRIRKKADAYRAAMPGASCTPKALRDWWFDVDQRDAGGRSFDHLPDV